MSDPIIETPPPIEVEIVTGAATPLSADTPEDLGTAAAGVSMEASRSDHVHPIPSAADVGADPAGAASTVAGDLFTHESLTTTAHGGIVGDTDARLTDARTPLAHTHGQSDVTGLVADMAAKQPLDSDLTAIAALSTTAFGRSLLEVVDAVGGRATLSAAAATHVHDGADITSGVVAPARLGSGTPDASTVLRGDGVWGLPTFSYVRDAMPGSEYGVAGVASTENGRLFITYTQKWWGVILFLPAGYYDRITVRTTVAGNQTANIGIYPCGPSGYPIPMSAPIANGGVMDFSGPPGLIHAGISLTLPEPTAVFAVMSATTFTTAATIGIVSTYGSANVIPPLIGLPVTPSSTSVNGGPLYGGLASLSLPGATAGVDVAPSTIYYGDYSIPWMRVRAA